MQLRACRSITPRHVAVVAGFATRRALLPSVNNQRLKSTTRALSAEDRLGISDLCFEFDEAVNAHDLDAVVSLFSENGEVHSPKGSVQGSTALLQYFKMVEPMARGNRHLTSNVRVKPESEWKAVVHSYRILHRACNPPALIASGKIEDVVVREGDTWKFASRRFIMDPSVVAPAA